MLLLQRLKEVDVCAKESPVNDNDFEVNEETLFNILSADMQGPSKMPSFCTFQALPTIPPSIAGRTNFEQVTQRYFYSPQIVFRATENYKNIIFASRKRTSIS